MTPVEIKIELLRAGINQNQIAKKVGCVPTLVSQVVHGIRPVRRVRQAIAETIGKPVEEIWPEENPNKAA
jgi:lambda repressor-like predicted transcriptional regulator